MAAASLCLRVMVSARMALGMLEARVHWITGGDLIQSGNSLGLPRVFTRTHVWRWEVGRCVCDASVFNARMQRNWHYGKCACLLSFLKLNKYFVTTLMS